MLLLIITTVIIFAGAIVPSIAFEIRRDREEEMIHRGVQYSRAIRLYYQKFGRYPTKLEDLESTNNQRFLRKRYKDPVAGKDFKLLHMGDVRLSLFGAQVANPVTSDPSDDAASADGQQGAAVNNNAALGQSSALAGTNSFGSTSGFGAQSPQVANTQLSGRDSFQSSFQGVQSNQPGSGRNANSGDQLSGQIIGGPIVGAVSSSKSVGIREFDHKKKYSEWQFVFDPAIRALPTTPNQRATTYSSSPLAPNSNAGTAFGVSATGRQNFSNNQSGGTSTPNDSGNPINQPGNPPQQ